MFPEIATSATVLYGELNAREDWAEYSLLLFAETFGIAATNEVRDIHENRMIVDFFNDFNIIIFPPF